MPYNSYNSHYMASWKNNAKINNITEGIHCQRIKVTNSAN